MQVTTKLLDDFKVDLKRALLGLQEKHGIALSMGNISYTQDSFHTKVTAMLVSPEDKNSGLNAHELKYKAALEGPLGSLYDLEGCFGRVIRESGKEFALIGINRSARRNPLAMQEIRSGKMFVCPESYGTKFRASTKVFDFEKRTISEQ